MNFFIPFFRINSFHNGDNEIMKRCCIIFLSIVIIILTAFAGVPKTEREYLRIHIRANSNGKADQAVKCDVRDAVVLYLTPLVGDLESKEEALAIVSEELPALEGIAEDILQREGFFYGAKVSLRKEEFPTRVYEDITLEAGVYDALILELGSGEGDNWWCVVYPALCFSGTPKGYKSFLWEILQKYIGG